MTQRTCRFDGCERTNIRGHGLCSGHYEQKRLGKVLAPLRLASLVDMTGGKFGRWTVTGRAHVEGLKARGAYWYCICNCGQSKIIHGRTLRDGTSKGCTSCRPTPTPRAAIPSYNSAHKRLHTDRGSASLQKCVECGHQADEWALVPNPSESLTGENNGSPATYSRNSDDYQPMCFRDHRRMDAWLRGERPTPR